MRRIRFCSPKLARPLVLFSYRSLDTWALIESCPLITHFCEHPGYYVVDDLATTWDAWSRCWSIQASRPTGARCPARAATRLLAAGSDF